MPILLGASVFLICFITYGYFRLSGRLHSEPKEKKPIETRAGKLYRSKVYDPAFFDGESEDITEAQSRIRIFGGG